MTQTINSGAIAQGFASLAQALAPNYQGMIQADLARAQRENTAADTAYRNALTGKTGLESDRLRADNAALAAGRAAMSAGIINPDGTPNAAGIAAIFGGSYGNPQAMAAVPGFVTGLRTSVDPNFVSDPNFSGVLTGTGVQPYQNTPAGQAAALANTLAGERVKADSAANVATINGQTDLGVAGVNADSAANVATINGQTDLGVAGINAGSAAATQRLKNSGEYKLQEGAQQFALLHPGVYVGKPGAGAAPKNYPTTPLDMARIAKDPNTTAVMEAAAGGPLSPSAQNTILGEAARRYDVSGNWPQSLQEAVAAFTYAEGSVDAPGWGSGNLREVTPKAPDPLAGVLSGQTNPAGAPPAAGAAAPAASAPPAAGGGQPQTATNPTTGEKLILQNGQWVPMQ